MSQLHVHGGGTKAPPDLNDRHDGKHNQCFLYIPLIFRGGTPILSTSISAQCGGRLFWQVWGELPVFLHLVYTCNQLGKGWRAAVLLDAQIFACHVGGQTPMHTAVTGGIMRWSPEPIPQHFRRVHRPSRAYYSSPVFAYMTGGSQAMARLGLPYALTTEMEPTTQKAFAARSTWQP